MNFKNFIFLTFIKNIIWAHNVVNFTIKLQVIQIQEKEFYHLSTSKLIPISKTIKTSYLKL